ncbi:MAG: hypothetical protein WC003_01980 [Terrimicrobiaceae bacterium]
MTNDFLRPCNCVHPAGEDCEKCVGETAVQKAPAKGDGKSPPKEKPKRAETAEKR